MLKKLSTRKQFWIRHINNFNDSGLIAKDYCKKHSINYKSFTAQKSQLKDYLNNNSIDNTIDKFVPIKNKINPSKFSIKLKSGIELTFEDLPKSEWLVSTINLLEELNA